MDPIKFDENLGILLIEDRQFLSSYFVIFITSLINHFFGLYTKIMIKIKTGEGSMIDENKYVITFKSYNSAKQKDDNCKLH